MACNKILLYEVDYQNLYVTKRDVLILKRELPLFKERTISFSGKCFYCYHKKSNDLKTSSLKCKKALAVLEPFLISERLFKD